MRRRDRRTEGTERPQPPESAGPARFSGGPLILTGGLQYPPRGGRELAIYPAYQTLGTRQRPGRIVGAMQAPPSATLSTRSCAGPIRPNRSFIALIGKQPECRCVDEMKTSAGDAFESLVLFGVFFGRFTF